MSKHGKKKSTADTHKWIRIAIVVMGVMIIALMGILFSVLRQGKNVADETEDDYDLIFELVAENPELESEIVHEPTPEEIALDKAQAMLSEMTPEEKIYQMFIVTPEQLTGVEAVTAAGEKTRQSLKQTPVGGMIYFSANLTDPEQTKALLSETKQISEDLGIPPLFLCVDEEGGRVSRIAKNSSYGVTDVGPMADVTSIEEAHTCGDTIGTYLNELGFNVDFAPDTDVLTEPGNTVIGDRSFGKDADAVSAYGVAYAKGLQKHGIMATFKHFPGHGATQADTHKGYAYTPKTLKELQEQELKPFYAAVSNNVEMIMVAHISTPEITGDDTPCTLSRYWVTDILRNEMGYQGLIITDAMNMGAIAQSHEAGDAVAKAVQAGVDIILMPADLQTAYTSVYNAIQDGRIPVEQIDESVLRILYAKIMGMEQDGQ